MWHDPDSLLKRAPIFPAGFEHTRLDLTTMRAEVEFTVSPPAAVADEVHMLAHLSHDYTNIDVSN